ncbi:cytochrome P450 2U1-like [Asterias amurensis]|uniref:cytochrome P450 2U1-like n=1 Tax=Asterias amurensis TaxID=7602 RepID=UPI003AB85F40
MASLVDLFESVGLKSFIIFLVSFLLGLFYLRLPRHLPPGPPGWLGVSNVLALSKEPASAVFTKWANRHGCVFSVRLIGKLYVVLNDLHSIKKALHGQPDVFSDRNPTKLAKLFGIKGSVSDENGDIWKEHRRFGVGALRSFGMGKQRMESSINVELMNLLEGFAEQRGKPFDPAHLVENAVSNIICKICLGHRFSYKDPEFAQLLEMVRVQLSYGPTSLLNAFPLLFHTPFYSNLRENNRSINEFFSKRIKARRETYDENNIRDMIDLHFAEVERRKRSGKIDDVFDDESLKGMLFDLFVAGTDTTSTALLWFLMYMARHPDTQRKVQAEIDDVIARSRQPSMSDSPNMPYTNAVMLEVQRMRPVAPTALPHYTREQTKLGDYTIPKHTTVVLNIWAVHHDPATWTEPERFNPDRFLSADGTSFVQHDTLLNFSTGRRVCMAEKFAKTNMFIFFVNMLQRFTFSFPEGKSIPSLEGEGGLVLTPGPFELCANMRP